MTAPLRSRPSAARLVLVALAIVTALVSPGLARVKVRADVDKSFDFKKIKTWAWRLEAPGDVKMALTKDDNPAAVKARLEPTIMQAVQDEMTRRGLTLATSGTPDVRVAYWVLISSSTSAQQFGQFASWTEWGLPPVPFGQTQSLRVLTQGSLILDVVPNGAEAPVWRGIAQAEVHLDRTEAERVKRIRDAVRDLLKRLPSTSHS